MTLARLCAAWIAGIAAAAAAGDGAWPLAGAIAAGVLAVAIWRRDGRLLLYAFALPLAFSVAVVRFDDGHTSPGDDAVVRYNGGVHVRLRGVVRDDPQVGDTSQRFAVSVRAIDRAGGWQPASGRVLVRDALYPRFRAGDVLELEGALEDPPVLDGFDYADYLARRGIASVMEYPATRAAGRDSVGPLRATVLRVRRRLSASLDLALAEPQSSLARGVLLGERSALPPGLRDELNATNTSHLVVVSGSNVVLVSAYATLLFAWLVGRRRALALSIVAVVGYAVLVGLSPPVLRATIMGLLLIVATLSGRPTSAITSLGLAAALMTGIDPPVVRDVSFQLSFAATAGIVYLASPLRALAVEAIARALRLDELPRWSVSLVAEPLAVTVAATLATAPLLALNFGRVSLVGLLANMLVVPAFPLIVGASLLAAVGGLLPEGRLVFSAPAHYLLTYWIEIARRLASAPNAVTSVHGYTARWAIVTYGFVAATAIACVRAVRLDTASRVAESRPLDLRRLRRIALVAVPALVLATGLGFALWPGQPRRLEVTVLDVGQGDAILIETPGGANILVDGGPGGAVLRGLGEELPWRDRSLDIVVLTHGHADHVSGLVNVLQRYDARRVMAAADAEGVALDDAWQAALSREHASALDARAGATFDLDDGVRLEVLWPLANATAGGANASSIVLRLTLGDVTFLLTGDIEEADERAVLASGVDLRADVLKVAHHGSATSSSRAFLDAVDPGVAVISVGRDNRFGHPSTDVVARLAEHAAVITTAQSGAVHIETDGRHIWVDTER